MEGAALGAAADALALADGAAFATRRRAHDADRALLRCSMPAISIFNDVIGPVMRGPSSSHCAAALRIGRLARDLMDGDLTDVLVEFDREGSLPTTHESQGSDMGLFGGLLGWDADDERLPDSARALADAGIALRIETVDVGDPHPNTYRLTLRNAREAHALIAISTGGGMMEVGSIDGVAALDGRRVRRDADLAGRFGARGGRAARAALRGRRGPDSRRRGRAPGRR